VDTTPPATPTVLNANDHTGSSVAQILTGNYTHASKPEFNGKGDPGDTITLYDKGVKIGETIVDANGNWSFTPKTPSLKGRIP
jgi:hypothetical protein